MEYSKLQLNWTRTITFRAASLVARGAWVSLVAHCADQENGGTIANCKDWSRDQWSAVCAVTHKDVATCVAAGLAKWDDVSLVVIGYDITGEERCRDLREQGKKGGRPKQSDNPTDNRTVTPTPNPDHTSPSRPGHPGQANDNITLSSPPGPEALGREDLFKKLRRIGCAVAFKDQTKQQEERRKWLEKIGDLTDAQVIEEVEQSDPRIVWASQFREHLPAKPIASRPTAKPDRRERVASYTTLWNGLLFKYWNKDAVWWSKQFDSLAQGELPDDVREEVIAACRDPRRKAANDVF